MAGGRPEYLPVLIAAVEAITDPLCQHQNWSATTFPTFPAVIVNGPVAKQIRLIYGYGVPGPDPNHPAGGSIGRAIRLLLMDLGGAIPEMGGMAIYGQMRFENAVFAEDEDGLPQGWDSASVALGFKKGSNVVTVLPVAGAQCIQLHSSFGPTAEEVEIQFLYRFAADMSSPGHFSGFTSLGARTRYSGIMLLARDRAYQLTKYGWTREKVVAFIQKNAKPSWDWLVKTGRRGPAVTPADFNIAPYHLVLAGGAQSAQGLWMRVGKLQDLTTSEIKLPAKAKWDALLKEAEEDLGPLPAPMR
jgi:hypothetical protein